ncbi:MAG: hypothetical protein HON68_06210 [Gammaproteobacteria bacterium]|jgi:hypothetical protein|nr:hypothetical protein [Gammaproteobacteria bacterium]MBT3489781.1 hypothetical protein [Gammaproteobacteria bacterium]MBT3718012.1 hypothetical protein [Gammaproteobacteria bacterium]MBT3843801.1 hypothetical protein [Gammaproteobacteria bacterium]MBT3893708.1 hypothetical protein [Gammaproteobacteria bacterium]
MINQEQNELGGNLSVEQLDEWATFYAQEESEADDIWASADWLQFKLESNYSGVLTENNP